jgi:hypothetical protein
MKKCNLILLYNYIAHFHEMIPWSMNQFIYANIVHFIIVYCQWFGFYINPFKLQYPHHQLTHVHVTLPSFKFSLNIYFK